MPATAAFVKAVQHALHAHADPQRAVPMAAYMKQRFPFLGIGTPTRRLATRPLLAQCKGASADALIACAQALFALPEREFHYVACDLLAKYAGQLGVAEIDALTQLAQQHSWWDSVDSLVKPLGAIVRADLRHGGQRGQAQMDALLHSPDFWLRRMAMLHQLGWRGDTDATRLFRYARTLAPESEFFIRKAIGWALRDYARHAPDAVRQFLVEHGTALSPLSVREAGKHLG